MMKKGIESSLLAIVFFVFFDFTIFAQEFIIPNTAGMSWYKGNTHSHSNQRVGSSSGNPTEDVALWYKKHGYQFLIISDIISSTKPEVISKVTDSTFLLIPGLEIKSQFGSHWVHTNGLNTQGVILAQEGVTLLETLQTDIDAIRNLGGVPQIDHPRYQAGPDKEAIFASRNCRLFEVYNGAAGPLITIDIAYSITEMDWDYILSNGKKMFGLAVDDDWIPGKAWIMVRAHRLDADEICRNMEEGLFYASTGVEIQDIQIDAKRIAIFFNIQLNTQNATCFIGEHGKQLLITENNPAVFELKEPIRYVRAKATDSNGNVAWIQPVFIQ